MTLKVRQHPFLCCFVRLNLASNTNVCVQVVSVCPFAMYIVDSTRSERWPKEAKKGRFTRNDMITWPAQPVNKEQEDNTHTQTHPQGLAGGGVVTSLSTYDVTSCVHSWLMTSAKL